MIRRWAMPGILWVSLGLAALAAPADAPSFQEICDLIRQHLPGITEADLQGAALAGVLKRFEGRVSLATNVASGEQDNRAPLVSKVLVYDDHYGYLRIGHVGSGLAEELAKGYAAVSATNKLKGVVVDLRFAGGLDYRAAAAAADLFLREEQPLFEWEGRMLRSKAKGDAIPGPAVVLVNRDTVGAAEVLAAVLRESRVGLLIGAPSAGRAAPAKEFKLKNGQVLRLASGAVKLGRGTELTTQGLKPDIAVQVPWPEEQMHWEDAYREFPDAAVSGLATNRPPRPKLNEAELVRLKKEGIEPGSDPAPRPVKSAELAKPQVRDRVLARALDLLKALAVVGSARAL